MAKKLLYFILIHSIAICVNAQWSKIGEFELDQVPAAIAGDFNGHLYLGYDNGSLVKLNAEGKELINYSLPNLSSISLIEPQFQLKTFLYYYDIQQITILDRFNAVPKTYAIRDFDLGIVNMSCPAPDGTFWFVENNPTFLKRIEPNQRILILETQPELGMDIRMMRSFQNILMIVDERGLHILDQFGSNLHYYEGDDIQYISLSENSIYFESADKVIKMNPFSGEVISEIACPIKQVKTMVYADGKFLFLVNNKLISYRRSE